MEKIKVIFLTVLFILVNSLSIYGKTSKPPDGKGTIEYTNLFKFTIPDNGYYSIGKAGGYVYWYDGTRAGIMSNPSIVLKSERAQFKNWSKSTKWIENYAKSIFGDELVEIKIDKKFENGLSFKLVRRKTEFYVTVKYRVTKHYIAEFVGFSTSGEYNSMIDKNIRDAVKSFEDIGPPNDKIRHFDKNEDFEYSKWIFPGTTDPFYVMRHYFDIEERPAPSKERQETDYIIKWKSVDFGKLMGIALGKNPNQIMSSDLDHIKDFDIRRIWGTESHYTFYLGERSYSIPVDGINITNFDDISEFKNLENLSIMLKNYKNISGVWKATTLRSIAITPNENITSLKGMENLVNLERISFWGGRFSDKLTDISPMSKLDKVKEIDCIAYGVKNLVPFSKMKGLENLSIHCHKNANVKPVVEAEQIKHLYVNMNTYR
ncbi:hypothetical protein [Fusobacterium sp. PH5-44]|uniref:hypothetical protein n=1 Tax=unclassified Fusobacterium TaxID=2648384 RepID=UPI003D2501A0